MTYRCGFDNTAYIYYASTLVSAASTGEGRCFTHISTKPMEKNGII